MGLRICGMRGLYSSESFKMEGEIGRRETVADGGGNLGLGR